MLVRLTRHTTALCVASLAVFVAMTALEFLYFRDLSGGLPSLDVRLAGFSPDEGMAWLTALGRRGSEIMLVWHYLTFDLLFPALLSVTMIALILTLGRLLPRFRAMSGDMQSVFALMLVVPYTLADYAQNIAVMRLLSNSSSANPDTLSLASALIVTKFALFAVPLIVIAVLFFAGQKQRWARQHKPGQGRN